MIAQKALIGTVTPTHYCIMVNEEDMPVARI